MIWLRVGNPLLLVMVTMSSVTTLRVRMSSVSNDDDADNEHCFYDVG